LIRSFVHPSIHPSIHPWFVCIRTRYHAAEGSSAALNSHAVLQRGHRLSLWDESHLLMHCRWNACEHTPKHTGDSSPGYRQSGAACSKAFRQMPQQSSFSPAFHVLYACVCRGEWACARRVVEKGVEKGVEDSKHAEGVVRTNGPIRDRFPRLDVDLRVGIRPRESG
jgi:hypothetical protein